MTASLPGILDLADVRAHVALFEGFYGPMEKKYPNAVSERLIDESLKRMLNAFTGDLIIRTGEAVAQAGIGPRPGTTRGTASGHPFTRHGDTALPGERVSQRAFV